MQVVLVDQSMADDTWLTCDSVSLAARYRLRATTLEVAAAPDWRGVEAALRLGWYALVTRAGGVLVHASAFAVDGRAFVVTGVSGTGKSTIARHAVNAGATLLSDEIVQVMPGGLVVGTPFLSDADAQGTPTVARLAQWLTIDQRDSESLTPWQGLDLMRTSASQVFTLEPDNWTSRLASLLDGVTGARFACRNHPDAGKFLVDALRNA